MSYRKSGTFIFMAKLLCSQIIASVNANLQENVALNKHAAQSSNLTYPGNGDVWSASNAVDGNKDCTNVDKDHFSGTAPEQVPWWQVDLGNIYSLSQINVYGQHEELPVQLRGFQVYLLTPENSMEKQHIYNNTNYANGGVFTIHVQQNVSGRYVRIEMPGTYRTAKRGPLVLCEVEVYSRECPPSKYRYNCNETCTTCTQMNCTYTDGECLNGCIPGYKPTDRFCHTACDAGTYGQNCSLTCSGRHCLNGNEHCDTTNGTCLQGCDRGYHGNSCESKCRSGRYGYGCNETCHHCKNGTICGFQTGDCRDGCNPGFEGTRCDKECKDGYFGDCTHRCHCKDKSKCSKTDGVCTNNCDFGWVGRNCSIDLNLIRQITHVVTNQTGVYETFGSSKAIDGKDRFDVDACNCCSVTNGAVPSWWQIDLGNKYLIDTVRIYGRADIGSSNDQLEHATIYASNYTMVNSNTTQKYIFEIPTITTTTVFTHHMRTAIIAQFFTVKGLRRILTICEFKLFRKACDVGRFGTGCNHTCYCSDNNSCDAITGKCQRHGCFPGWRGESCDLKCESRSFGEKCNRTCHCINKTNCDNVNGHCEEHECDPGWKGASCETECDSRSFGQNCSHTCHCINQTDCDNVNGFCEKHECDPGWKGASCETKCESRFFGKNCSHTCHCINQTICDNVNGHCEKQECEPGWKGASCDTKCDSRSFGQNCSHTCHCINQTNCDNVKGHCEKHECDPGWKGGSCDTKCASRSFGKHCNYICHCINQTNCDNVNGQCEEQECDPGWKGPSCETKCESRSFGKTCSHICYCINQTNCDNVNGHCEEQECDPGWTGASCETKCDSRSFGQNCRHTCHCINQTNCDNVNGHCEKQDCDPGWKGASCDTNCDSRSFGQNCSQTCHCINQSNCDNINGFCEKHECDFGWKGASCETKCESKSFGKNCSHTCHCINQTNCDNVNGHCEKQECEPGWKGASCDIKCDSRSFGQNCSHTCHCINQSDCDNVKGHCEKHECDPGWKGASCDTNNNILYRLRFKIKTSMSTVAGNWTSDRAVDGDTGPDPYKCQCCSGTTNEPLSWWMVDLGERVPVHGITIYSRNNENDNRQLQGFQVILSADNSYNASAFMSKSLEMFSKMYVIKLKNILTRFIKIQRPGILTLCEVKVFQGVCEQGTFGQECSRECHCGDNKPCNQQTGYCQSSACKPGWQGPSCNETCPPETFGDNCSDSCYCAEGTCTNNYGICLGRCRQGYHGAHCNQVGSEVKSDRTVLLSVVGSTGAFLVGAVIIGIVVLKLRRRSRESVKSEYETPNRRASQTEIQEYDTIGNVTDSPAYENETATGL